MPSRNSKQQDHWGYFNGAVFNDNINTLIPTITIGTQTFTGANRNPNFNFAKAGVITKITYPTGGHTQFEYELNTVQGSPASGLRIKKITTHDGTDPAKDFIRSFVYENPNTPGISSGKLVRPLAPYYEMMTFIMDDPTTTIPGKTIDCNFYRLSSQSVYSLGTTQGGAVGYTHVTEITGNNGNNGKTEYEFSFIPDFDVFNSMDWHRGKMLQKTDFARTPSGYKKVTEQIFTYNFSGSVYLQQDISSLHVKPNKVGLYPFTGPGVNYLGMFNFTGSKIQSRWVIPTSAIERTYSSDGVSFLEKKTDYFYDNYHHGQITRSITYKSDGRIAVKKNKYIRDYVSTLPLNVSAGTPKVQDLLDKNMGTVLVESQEWEGTSVNDLALISGSLREFDETGTAPNGGKIILPTAIWHMGSATPVAAAVFTPEENLTYPQLYAKLIPGNQVAGKNWYIKDMVYQYDSYGNLIQQQKLFGNPIAYIWGYNRLYAIAQANNAAWNEIAFTSFENDYKGNWAYAGTPSAASAKTGKKSYSLTTGSISKAMIPPGEYILSYWAQGNVSTSSGTPTSNSGVDTDSNGWTYFEKKITYSSLASLMISGSGLIDELRLHPADASMTTVTYNPQGAMTGIMNSENISGNFEFDPFGRLTLTRDHEGNILERITYNFKN
ncbi:MAG: hypothetical protein R3C61_00850 [Bacteroidia bacterium]